MERFLQSWGYFMATILIAENDDLLARQMAHTLRQAGHVPILAQDARAALREARTHPDGILLDLELPNLSLDNVLKQLTHESGTAPIPVLIVIAKREAAAQLRASGRVAAVLRKPVSDVQLREAVDKLPVAETPTDSHAPPLDRPRQRQLILHLIAHGPDGLALQISRRLCVDRLQGGRPKDGETLSWEEIAEWGQRAGLVDAEQARLLGRMSLPSGNET
jgi:CheY-like chemotaxis protein